MTAERAVLRRVGRRLPGPDRGARYCGRSAVHLRAIIVSPDGTEIIREASKRRLPADAAAIGRTLGEQLLAAGGAKILEAVYGASRTWRTHSCVPCSHSCEHMFGQLTRKAFTRV